MQFQKNDTDKQKTLDAIAKECDRCTKDSAVILSGIAQCAGAKKEDLKGKEKKSRMWGRRSLTLCLCIERFGPMQAELTDF